MQPSTRRTRRLSSVMVAALVACGVALAPNAGRSAEIVPQIGLTRSVNGNMDANTFGGLAVRGSLAPMLDTEIGISYRSESRFDDRLTVRQWPLTASLYLRPVQALYAGAGVGWYHTTYDYSGVTLLHDETKEQFGVHVGGGLVVPVTSAVGLDLSGRYVMMEKQESRLVPEKFDPDFWTTSLGLAFRF